MSGFTPKKTPHDHAKAIILDRCKKLDEYVNSRASALGKASANQAIQNIKDNLSGDNISAKYIETQLQAIRNVTRVYGDNNDIIDIDAVLGNLSSPAVSKNPTKSMPSMAVPSLAPKAPPIVDNTAALLRAEIEQLKAQLEKLNKDQETLSSTNESQLSRIKAQQQNLDAQATEIRTLAVDNKGLQRELLVSKELGQQLQTALNQARSQLEKQLFEAATREKELGTDLSTAQRQLKEQETVTADVRKELAAEKVKSQQLTDSNQGLTEANKDLQTKLSEALIREAALGDQLSAAQKQLTEQESVITSLRTELSKSQEQVKQLSDDNSVLQATNDALQKDLSELKQTMEGSLHGNQAELAEKITENAELLAANGELQQKLSAAELREGGLQRTLSEKQTQIERQQLENGFLKAQIVGLSQELDQQKKELPIKLAEQRVQLHQLEAKTQSLKQENEQLVGIIKADKDELGKVIELLQKDNLQKDIDIKQLKDDAKAQQKTIDGLQGKLLISNDDKELLKGDLQAQQKTIDGLQGKLLISNDDKELLKGDLQAQQKTIDGLQGKLLISNDDKELLKGDVQDLLREKESLEATNQTITTKMQELEEGYLLLQQKDTAQQKQIAELQEKLKSLEESQSSKVEMEESVSEMKKVPTIELTPGTSPKLQDQQTETTQPTGLLDSKFGAEFNNSKSEAGLMVDYGDKKDIIPHFNVDNIIATSSEMEALISNSQMQFDGDPPDKAQIHSKYEVMSKGEKLGVVLILEGVSKSNEVKGENINVTISHFEDKDLLDILEKLHSNLGEKLKDPTGSDLQKMRCVEINYKGGDPKVKELIDEHNKVAKDTINVPTTSAKIKQETHAKLMEKIQSTKESLKTEPSNAPKSQQHKQTL